MNRSSSGNPFVDSKETRAKNKMDELSTSSSSAAAPWTLTLHVQVTGMMCQRNCGTTVRNALLSTSQTVPTAVIQPQNSTGLKPSSYRVQVLEAQAIFAESRAYVVYECSTLNQAEHDDATMETLSSTALPTYLAQQVVEAIENVGFDAVVIPDVQVYLQQLQAQASSTSAPEESWRSMGDDSESSHQSDQGLLSPIPSSSTPEDDHQVILQVLGMSCAVCTGRVRMALLSVPGVQEAAVVLPTSRAIVEVARRTKQDLEVEDDKNADAMHHQRNVAQACVAAVRKAGYECHLVAVGRQDGNLRKNAQQLEDARQGEISGWRRLVLICIFFTLPLLLMHHGYLQFGTSMVPSGSLMLALALSTAVQFGAGRRYYRAAWHGWVNGRVVGMDFLVVLGTSASYLLSVILLMIQAFTGGKTSMAPTFATGAMLLTFVTVGKFLEAYAKGKTASALQALMELQPISAFKVVLPAGDEEIDLAKVALSLPSEEVDMSQVNVGDLLRVLPGSRIPTDGVLVAVSSPSRGLDDQQAFVDESALSGEPFPVAKSVGDILYGSTVNQLRALVMKVTATGGETTLAKIVRLVEEAQRQKAPIEAFADKIASVFAPAVIVISLITFVAWIFFNEGVTAEQRLLAAILSSISVVVVACPCALGLATPTAVMVGTGVGATQGLLIKGGAVLENMHRLETIIFDKTGTITSGKPVLGERVEFLADENAEELVQNLPSKIPKDQAGLWLAACAESQSEHPIATAIVNAAKKTWGGDVTCFEEGVRVEEFQVVPGMGVECLVSKPGWGGWFIRVGSKQWTSEGATGANGDITGYDGLVNDFRRRGHIVVYATALKADCPTSSRRLVGIFGIIDPIQPEAKSTVAALQRMGIDVWLCTGDHELTAMAIAREIGISDSNVCAGVTPEGKADLVERLQTREIVEVSNDSRQRNGTVAMVGDGINDAVALARADIGVAIGAGTQVATEAANVVLVRSSLHDVVVAIHLSQVVFRRIIMNFVWAMSYNLFALPFAAGALYPFTSFQLPPQLAGFMMACSSVSVVTSSLLLRNYKRPDVLESGVLEGNGGLLNYLCEGVHLLCCLSRRRRKYDAVETKQVDLEMV